MAFDTETLEGEVRFSAVDATTAKKKSAAFMAAYNKGDGGVMTILRTVEVTRVSTTQDRETGI